MTNDAERVWPHA